MDEMILDKQKTNKQLGFHYYNDASHFDDASVDYWLPKLKTAGARWLVISACEEVEIPENFIERLIACKIEPIVVLNMDFLNTIPLLIFQQRMDYYHRIGIHLVQFFNRPNMKTSWNADEWQKGNLVEKFVKKFAEYAAICVIQKIIPIFPLLQPGGDYWDLAFLQTSIRVLKRDYAEILLPNMVFSANASLEQHPLDWGKGGPDAYPPVNAYGLDQIDHRGFYIFEWYQKIIFSELGKNVPMILFSAGRWSSQAGVFDVVTKESKKCYFQILNLLQVIHKPGKSEIPNYVICCNMYKLPSAAVLNWTMSPNALANNVNLEDEKRDPKTAKTDLLKLMAMGMKKVLPWIYKQGNSFFRKFGTNFVTILQYIVKMLKEGKSPSEYFLIPELSEMFTAEQLDVIDQYIKIKKCGSGNNLNEALSAKNVIMMNNSALYPAYVIQQLNDRNCKIQLISL